MNIKRKYLSDGLRKIYNYEIAQGNEVNRVDEPAGSNCSYSIVFKKKLFSINSKDPIFYHPAWKY